MSRIQIALPEKFLYTTAIAVRMSDINYGGHLGHDSILTLMQEARVLFYRQLGFKDELSLDGSVGQIVSDAAVVYKSESFYGDILVVEIDVADFTKYGFDMLYRITNQSTGKEVAIGKTGIVCFDYAIKKVARVPDIVLQRLNQV